MTPPVDRARRVDLRSARRLAVALRPSTGLIVLGAGLLVACSLTSLAGPMLMRYGIDSIVAEGKAEDLQSICLLWFVLLVLTGLFQYALALTTSTIGQRAVRFLRENVYDHLQRLPIAFYDRTPSGRLLTGVTNDVEALEQLLTQGAVEILGDALELVGIAVVLVWLNPKLALMSFLAIPVLVSLSLWFRRATRAAMRVARAALSRMNTTLQETFQNVDIIQSFGRQQPTERAFADINEEHLRASYRTIRSFALYFPLVEFVQTLVVAALLYYGGAMVLSEVVSFGVLVAFVQYTGRFFRPISDLSENLNQVVDALAASERIFTILDEAPEIDLAPAADFDALPSGPITCENLCFSYGEAAILHDLNCAIPNGKITAIVGPSGAGKSTLIHLLSRLYEPTTGTISIGHRKLADIPKQRLRQVMAVVRQEIFLFSGTVAENITLLRPEIPVAQLANALADSGAQVFIDRKRDGLATQVHPQGDPLSVGEQSLLAFARALLCNPQILILDEATATVDSETETLIQGALAPLLEGRTTIVVAHRLATIRRAHHIIYLKDGRIAEQGSHDELLAASGLYARLWTDQTDVLS